MIDWNTDETMELSFAGVMVRSLVGRESIFLFGLEAGAVRALEILTGNGSALGIRLLEIWLCSLITWRLAIIKSLCYLPSDCIARN